ncbi:hypothetical protein FA95DRAFT_1613882 [Auriscalpium vulgare]|uniref:Uncharacterized protein n=1 Tax=Auriscalpium vulgare TaxID=40419 RepID=A0ACB8R1J6_9AGAM|nr:hypothetical protein FA95DRAFT_1613882 [Auriscalpium vulgare]
MAGRAVSDLEDPEVEAQISPEDDLSLVLASLDLSTLKLPHPPPQSNGHHYRVDKNGKTVHMEAWYRAADASQGVPGARVRAFDANDGGQVSSQAEPIPSIPPPPPIPLAPASLPAATRTTKSPERDLRDVVVYRGFIPGLYDWQGAVKQVVGYPDGVAMYRKSSSEERAVREWRRAF